MFVARSRHFFVAMKLRFSRHFRCPLIRQQTPRVAFMYALRRKNRCLARCLVTSDYDHGRIIGVIYTLPSGFRGTMLGIDMTAAPQVLLRLSLIRSFDVRPMEMVLE